MKYPEEPKVSIILPTHNSASTIGWCLKSIKRQTYPSLEIIVVDGYSNDATIDVARKFGAKVLFCKSLLGARARGFAESKGEYILLLDSDQILMPMCVQRAVKMAMQGYDALVLEELSYEAKTVVQRLYEADRKLIHETFDAHPLHGVLLARFYSRWVLEKAFNNIPHELLSKVVVYDHAIINYEAYKAARRIGFLRNALYHVEPESLRQVVLKFYRYGKTARYLVGRKYGDILARKIIPRKGVLNPLKVHYTMASLLLYFLEAIPFAMGYLAGGE